MSKYTRKHNFCNTNDGNNPEKPIRSKRTREPKPAKTIPRYLVTERQKQRRRDFNKDNLPTYLHNSDVLLPNCGCGIASGYASCNNAFCLRHGHKQRWKLAKAAMNYDYSSFDSYYCTMNYDGDVSEQQFCKVWKLFLRYFNKDIGKEKYFKWAEFIDAIPHWNFFFRVAPGSNEKKMKALIANCWKKAILKSKLPWIGQPTYCKLIPKTKEDTEHVIRYIYKTNKGSLKLNNCRPKGWGHKTGYIHRGWKLKPVAAKVKLSLPVLDWTVVETPIETLLKPLTVPSIDPSAISMYQYTALSRLVSIARGAELTVDSEWDSEKSGVLIHTNGCCFPPCPASAYVFGRCMHDTS